MLYYQYNNMLIGFELMYWFFEYVSVSWCNIIFLVRSTSNKAIVIIFNNDIVLYLYRYIYKIIRKVIKL